MQRWSEDTTKLNAVEIAKLEKDGLDVLADIERYAQLGFKEITASDIDRLKWLGLYVQRPKTDERFMLRVKVPGGILNAAQAAAVADLAAEYGRGVVDITTRQSLQLHWVAVEDLPSIFKRLGEVGLTTVAAAGDCPRNIITSPLAGFAVDELFDVQPLVQQLNRFFEYNRDYSNLPRKFKIAITAEPYNSIHAETNDLAFTPAVKEVRGETVQGFHIAVGGGLSNQPQLAAALDIFVRQEEVVKVAAAVAAIFRDYGYREKRNHARLKFVVADWGLAAFTDKLLQITGPLLTRGTDLTKGWNKGLFQGVQPQKQAGLNYLGLTIPAGRLTAADFKELARLATTYGTGALRTTNGQNLVLLNITDAKVAELQAEPLVQKLVQHDSSYAVAAVTCTGKEFCPFAAAETKQVLLDVLAHVDAKAEFVPGLRIGMSGCKHSCGHPQTADIGLQGTVAMVDGTAVEAFEVWVGGQLGPDAQLAQKLTGTVPSAQAGEAIVALLASYQAQKAADEAFAAYVERTGVATLQTQLAQYLIVR